MFGRPSSICPAPPMPVLMRTNLDLAAKGLGPLGAYRIPEALWDRVVPPDFLGAIPEGGVGRMGPRVSAISDTL